VATGEIDGVEVAVGDTKAVLVGVGVLKEVDEEMGDRETDAVGDWEEVVKTVRVLETLDVGRRDQDIDGDAVGVSVVWSHF
jgi:hypothetical protein